MPRRPLVSVIIPAYNAEQYLGATLASIQAQTHTDLEIIVTDDGSTDSTAMIVRAASRIDARIRLIQQDNRGVAAARNRGLAEAQGKYVAPLDADDVWHPQNLALQVEALREAGSGVAVCYAWYVTINEFGALRGAGPRNQLTHRQDVLMAQLQGNFIGNSSSTVMRRVALEAAGGYDTTLRARNAEGCEDQALYISLSKKWDYTCVPQYLIGYRKHPGSMSQNRERMALSQALVLADLHKLRPRLPKYWFAPAVARIYEGQLAEALLHKQWRQAVEAIIAPARVSRGSLMDLLGHRMPLRIAKYCIRKLLVRPIVSEPVEIGVARFWSTALEHFASQTLYPENSAPMNAQRRQA